METIEFNVLKKHLLTLSPIVLIGDSKYILPTLGGVKKLLEESFIEEYKYVLNKFDCNSYALILKAWVRQKQYQEDWEFPIVFGSAWGIFIDVRNGEEYHARNFVLCEDMKLYLPEPQNDGIILNIAGNNMFDALVIE